MKTIARISPASTVRVLALAGLYLAILLPAAVLVILDALRTGSLIWIAVVLPIAVLTARGFIEQAFLLGALCSGARAVLWERDGVLVHLSPRYSAMKVSDIDGVEIVRRRRGFGKRPYVLITSKRKKIFVLTDVCEEAGDEIVSRLRDLGT